MEKKMNIAQVGVTIEDIMTCSICLEKLRDPKRLPCEHYFCKQCLADILKVNIVQDGKVNPKLVAIDCPVCRHLVKDFKCLDSFKLDLIMRRLVDTYKEMLSCDDKPEYDFCCLQSAFCTSKANLICVKCEGNFCSNCMAKIPSLCPKNEHLNSQHQQHEVFYKIDKSTYLCCAHNLSVDLFCEICQKLICMECYLLSHKEHLTKTVHHVKKGISSRLAGCESIANANKMDLSYLQDYSKKIVEKLDEKCDETINLLERQQILALGFLCLSFDQIQQHVKDFFKTRKDEILREMDSKANSTGKTLSEVQKINTADVCELNIIACAAEIERNIQSLIAESKSIQDKIDMLKLREEFLIKPVLSIDGTGMLESISKIFKSITFEKHVMTPRPLEIPVNENQHQWLRNYLKKSNFMKELQDDYPDYDSTDAGLVDSMLKLEMPSSIVSPASVPIKTDTQQLPWLYTTDSSDDEDEVQSCKAIGRTNSSRTVYSRDMLLQYSNWNQRPECLPDDCEIVLDKFHLGIPPVKGKRKIYSRNKLLEFRFWAEKPTDILPVFPVLNEPHFTLLD